MTISYIEGINCEVDTFGAECIEVNRYYGKNNATKDVKVHHYIISFAPEDNITMREAMDFGKEYVEKFLPGHQAILAVHPDGHNGTGNVHVHIVINSVRKYEGKKERWISPANTGRGANIKVPVSLCTQQSVGGCVNVY